MAVYNARSYGIFRRRYRPVPRDRMIWTLPTVAPTPSLVLWRSRSQRQLVLR